MSLYRLLKVPEDEITPEELYLSRRQFMRAAAAVTLGAAASAALGQGAADAVDELLGLGETDETPTPYEAVTTYNNFYEFGYDKADPSRRSGDFVTEPWSVTVEGLVENTGTFALEELVARFEVERRVCRASAATCCRSLTSRACASTRRCTP